MDIRSTPSIISLALVCFFLSSVHGWGMATGPCGTKPTAGTDRRGFVQSSILTFTTIASVGPLSPQSVMATGSDDPFAALDSLASTMGTNPPAANSATTSNTAPNNEDTKGAPQSMPSSDMNNALKNIRKQRQIDPRTHG